MCRWFQQHMHARVAQPRLNEFRSYMLPIPLKAECLFSLVVPRRNRQLGEIQKAAGIELESNEGKQC